MKQMKKERRIAIASEKAIAGDYTTGDCPNIDNINT
jgi:hypothetical protein